MKLNLIFAILFTLTLSLQSFAQSKCSQVLSQEGFREAAVRISKELQLDQAQSEQLTNILKINVDLQEYVTNADFVAYVKGVVANKSLNELRPHLYKLWQLVVKNEGDINLLKDVTEEVKSLLAQESYRTTTEATKTLTRWEKTRYTIERLLMQLKSPPATMRKIKTTIKAEMHPSILDSRIFDFYGYLNLRLDVSRLRPWNQIQGSFGSVKLQDIEGSDPTTIAKILMLATEIEQPIEAYSNNSGEVLRGISPQASRFMGKTAEQAEAFAQARARGEKGMHCKASWCFEENRHEGVLNNTANNLTGRKLPMNAPFTAYEGLSALSVEDAFFHLISRNDTEWHAASAYFIAGGHLKGSADAWVANVRQDELKHMSIFGGLYKYLLGDTYNKRMVGMLKKAMLEVKEKGTKSGEYGDIVTSEPIVGFEAIYTHVLYEIEIRKFFKSLPLKTLRKIYETNINVKEIPSVEMNAEKKQALDKLTAEETEKRIGLARWPKGQREKALAVEEFERNHSKDIDNILNDHFRHFKGAEDYGSKASIRTEENIDWLIKAFSKGNIYLQSKDLPLLKESLRGLLRDYQIMNNSLVRRLGLKVEFIDAVKGFDIVRDATYDALKKAD